MKHHPGRWVIAVIAGVGLVAAFRWSPMASAAETTHKTVKKTSATESSGDAVVERRLQDILNRQEEILKTQETILQKFDAVMDELRIIKVRASAH